MSIPDVESWLASPQGRYVLDWERPKVDHTIADVFGFNALQLGLPQCDLLAESRIALRRKVGPEGPVDVVADLAQLPFDSATIDLVVLPHVLEFHAEPHQVLREVERVLIPEGQLLILGFNPLSLWGARRYLPGCCDGEFPWYGQYLSVLRLRDWLQLLGFELDRGAFGCYVPPCNSERWLQRWRFMELAGDRWWGFAGGVYMLRAIKRVPGMRLVQPNWRRATKTSAKALAPLIHKESEDV
jgi:SAM-dependent methyltransferase